MFIGHYGVAFAALLVTSAARLHAQNDPSGYYEGTATSKQSGQLSVSLNLARTSASFGGKLVTPIGTFPITGGRYANGGLHLEFDAGGATGVIDAELRAGALTGAFSVPDDSGPIKLRRIGNARSEDSMRATLNLDPKRWSEDVRVFAKELPRLHANAFAHFPRRQFNAEIEALQRDIAQLDGDQIYVRLDRLANRVGDGHTYIDLPQDYPDFPLVFRRFGGEYRVVATAPEYARTLGTRLEAIDGVPAKQVRQRLLQITPAGETLALRDARAEDFLTSGALLHGLGITRRRDSVSYAFRDDQGQPLALAARAVPANAQSAIAWNYVYKESPLSRQHRGESFWFTYLPDSRTVYGNFRGYEDLRQHGAALLAFVADKHPVKLIVDMRQNGGGDFTDGLRYLIDPIRRTPSVNRRGHLYVLIGPNTFSAAMANAAQFRSRTHAILVGEPIGERPNSYQEPRILRLPNSHLAVHYSTRYYKFKPSGENIIRPDCVVNTSWADYVAGRDPVVQRILRAPDVEGIPPCAHLKGRN